MAGARSPLTREDWARAALDALATGGLRAVAVEPLAKRLGATKGSFYWHFEDRAALIEAALERWSLRTEAIAGAALAEPGGPPARLRRLFELAFADATTIPDGALLAEVHDPRVSEAVARVTRRRLDVLERLYADAGAGDPAAEARYAYTAFLGLIALRRVAPDALDDVDAHVAGLADRLAP